MKKILAFVLTLTMAVSLLTGCAGVPVALEVPKDDSVKEEVYEGIARQTVADAIRTCKGTVMKERLMEAIEDAGRQGLVGRQEYQELKKEFAQ